MEILPLPGPYVSHLAVQLDRPAEPSPLCLLYLHGFGSTQSGDKAEFFRARALAAGLAFCSFDFEGHGQSGGMMRGLTLTRNLTDTACVHAFLKQRGFTHIVLVGSSMGGATAMWYAALHHEEVAAGLYIAPALGLGETLATWAGPERLSRWEEEGSLPFANDAVSAELGWELIEDLRRHPIAVLLEIYRTPALILQGKRDTSVPYRDVVDFALACPFEEIELHLFADGDHRLIDRLSRLWELMLGFLRDRRLISGPRG
jgi:pimeloyl-ACP methyl ester carboxylesterase